MFRHPITVQLHHTDAYGILFFANQFHFCHDTFQAWLDTVGLGLPPTRQEATELAVIVHAEADYLAPLRVGDHLEAALTAERIGTTSFTMGYAFTRRGSAVGRGRTVHVLTDPHTATKVPLPAAWRTALARLAG